MKPKHLKIFGIVLVIVGFVLPFTNPDMAVVVYDVTPPSVSNPNPPGSSGSPSTLTVGATVNVRIEAIESESEIAGAYCEVTAVTGDSYSNTLTLQFQRGYADEEEWGKDWVVPDFTQDTVLRFHFSVTDGAGNTATRDSYGAVNVAGGDPDGYFTINDQQVTTTSIVFVQSATLNFKFVATQSGSEITEVNVAVEDQESYYEQIWLTESVDDQEWTGTFTLPFQGTFQVEGYVYTSSMNYRKMQVTVQLGEQTRVVMPSLMSFFNVVTIVGLLTYAVGVLMEKKLVKAG